MSVLRVRWTNYPESEVGQQTVKRTQSTQRCPLHLLEKEERNGSQTKPIPLIGKKVRRKNGPINPD